MMRQPISNRDKARVQAAFTQVELLVVLAVIGVVGMMGLAASAKLINQTKIAQCSVNLRQMDLAQLMYAADNSDNLPRNQGNWVWDVSGTVTTPLLQYGVVPKTMYCPGTAPRFTDELNWANPQQSLWYFGAPTFHVIGYAMTLGSSALPSTNRNLTVNPQPVTVGALVIPLQPPSQRVLTADANLSLDGVNFTTIYGGFTYNGGAYPHICPHLDGAYPAGGNVGMLDGHVEWRAFKNMKIETAPGTPPSFYW